MPFSSADEHFAETLFLITREEFPSAFSRYTSDVLSQ